MENAQIEFTQLFIDGKFVDSIKNETISVIDPGTEEEICKVQAASEEDVNLAVQAALRALPGWKKISVEEKQKLFYKAADLIEAEFEYLVKLESMDNGKPYSEAEFDISEVANGLRYYGGWIPNVCGRTYTTTNEYTVQTRKEPCGVVALIAPWNYPLLMDAWKFCPALAAGNTIVLKPSEETPLSILKLADIFSKAGFPAGVFNVVPGYGHIAGEALARHLQVDKISFTGSTFVGRKIMEASAQSNLKKIHLELGGKAPVIIFNDANVDRTLEWLWNAAFFTSGQNCCQGSRVYCQKEIYPTIVERLQQMANNPKVCKVGYWSEEGVNMGPVTTRKQFEKVLSYIDIGKNQEKLKLIAGGDKLREKGFFIPPTIFADVPDTSKLCKDEIFGPVLVLMTPFETVDEAILRGNDTTYGLACGIFSENQHKIERCVRELKFGNVWVNNYNMNPFWAPFGGFKQSGFGKDNGEDGIQEYTITKTVYYKFDEMY